MITVDVQVDIAEAVRALNLLEREAERAAYRAINKIADEMKVDNSKEIGRLTGIAPVEVLSRMYVRGASANRLMATVNAMPSAKNVGYYTGANPVPRAALSSNYGSGVSLKAWGKGNFYDKAFVMGKQESVGGIKRKVWKRTGPGPTQISDKVWGPSIRKTFQWPQLQKRQVELVRQRWPKWFEFYLRGEIAKLRGRQSLTGIRNVLPTIQGPTITGLP